MPFLTMAPTSHPQPHTTTAAHTGESSSPSTSPESSRSSKSPGKLQHSADASFAQLPNGSSVKEGPKVTINGESKDDRVLSPRTNGMEPSQPDRLLRAKTQIDLTRDGSAPSRSGPPPKKHELRHGFSAELDSQEYIKVLNQVSSTMHIITGKPKGDR